MSVAVPFGQYVPVDSAVHRLDARAKMGLATAFTLALFAVDGFLGMSAAALAVATAVRASRVPARLALRGVRSILVVLAFTLLAHALRRTGIDDTLVTIGPVAVSAGGLRTGAFFASRIVLLVVGTSLVTLTTPPVALTDGLERLMRPLSRVGFPSEDVAMMLTIALRFIPTTATEAERVIAAQRARGARFGSGGPVARARAYVPVLVPLFVNLFRRAEDLATAMESRCYRGGPGRTRLREPKMGSADWITMFGGVVFFVALGVLA